MQEPIEIRGLVAAVHTPFGLDRELRLEVVERQAERLLREGVSGVFVAGTTGECHSLRFEERRRLAERWIEVARGTSLRVIVHVGSNCLRDAAELARLAANAGAAAVAAMPPSYFKPETVDALIECSAEVARAAPETPFYFYEIPSYTGVRLPAHELLSEAGDRIPTLRGAKFTNLDLVAYQLCLRALGGRFDMPWGLDECLLGALAVGARGTVGGTYNFTAPIFQRLLDAFAKGDGNAAAEEQFRSVRLQRALETFGFLGAAKAVMGFLGVEVGPPRLPLRELSEREKAELRRALEKLGYFDWIRAR